MVADKEDFTSELVAVLTSQKYIRIFYDLLPLGFPLAGLPLLPLPNDLPSKPGRLLPAFEDLDGPPFRLSFLRSLRIAILSDLFFCRAAIDASTCSFLSDL